MLKEIPYIDKGKRKVMYQASDGETFIDREEAEWYEYTDLKLKRRKIKVEVPEHDVFEFPNKDEFFKYLENNYYMVEYKVNFLEEVVFPEPLVIQEEKQDSSKWIIKVQTLKKFKEGLIAQMEA